MEEAWADDEFVVDPTRITVHIGKTGIDGNTFKDKYLMDKHGIQINKTSRNTILFMVNIGTSRRFNYVFAWLFVQNRQRTGITRRRNGTNGKRKYIRTGSNR